MSSMPTMQCTLQPAAAYCLCDVDNSISPGHIPADIIPLTFSSPGQFTSFLHGVEHFPFPPLPSAYLQYKAIYR